MLRKGSAKKNEEKGVRGGVPSQTLIVPSRQADTILVPSSLYATDVMALRCDGRIAVSVVSFNADESIFEWDPERQAKPHRSLCSQLERSRTRFLRRRQSPSVSRMAREHRASLSKSPSTPSNPVGSSKSDDSGSSCKPCRGHAEDTRAASAPSESNHHDQPMRRASGKMWSCIMRPRVDPCVQRLHRFTFKGKCEQFNSIWRNRHESSSFREKCTTLF